MANPIAIPADIILAISTIKASGVDPNDFNNAVQELYNRGYGYQGKWIQDHKDLYMQALQDGYVAEGADGPNSEPAKNVVPPPIPPANDPEDAGINPEPPVDTSEGFPDTSTGETSPDDGVEPAEPTEDKPHKRK